MFSIVASLENVVGVWRDMLVRQSIRAAMEQLVTFVFLWINANSRDVFLFGVHLKFVATWIHYCEKFVFALHIQIISGCVTANQIIVISRCWWLFAKCTTGKLLFVCSKIYEVNYVFGQCVESGQQEFLEKWKRIGCGWWPIRIHSQNFDLHFHILLENWTYKDGSKSLVTWIKTMFNTVGMSAWRPIAKNWWYLLSWTKS